MRNKNIKKIAIGTGGLGPRAALLSLEMQQTKKKINNIPKR